MTSPVILVTGGSRGIGAAICRLAAQRGYDVAVNYARDADAAQAVARAVEDAGQRACMVQADVADAAQVGALFDQVEQALGPVRTLVNNAGVTGTIARLADVTPALIQETVDVNIMGAILPSREFVRRYALSGPDTRPDSDPAQVIVNISSVAATLGSANTYVWYAAAKGAIDSFTLGLAQEVIGDGIRVVGVAPGLTDTDIHAAGGVPDRAEKLGRATPIGRPAAPEEIAEAVLWIASRQADYVVGEILRVGGGR